MHTFIELIDGRIDLTHRQVLRDHQTGTLTAREADLLTYLAQRPGQTISRDVLLVEVWGYHPNAQTRTIDTTVRRVRTKIEPDPATPTVLLTVHGEGYRLVPPVTADAPLGRAELAARLAALPPGVHTLVGPGGVGKTCLALHWSADLFIDLSAVDDLPGVLRVVATVLDVTVAGETTAALQQLGFAWAARGPTRVVLDNAEQVRAAVHQCVAAWQTPQLTWLITSREALELDAETVIAVPPLAPDDAARLFAKRAVRADATHDAAAVARLMQRLDHLPLAIELAAARTGILNAAQLADRVEGSLAVLRTTDGTRPARHQSLDAALDGSWSLLSAASQKGLRACALFRGGFDLDAAEAVLGATAIDTLEDLLARQLVVRRGERFTLLETVRTYVARHPVAPAAVDAHALHFVERAEVDSTVVDREFANLQVIQQGAPPWSIRAGLVLLPNLHRRGPLTLYTRIVHHTASAADQWPDARLRMRALHARADVHRSTGATEQALADGQIALALAEELDDGPWRARILARLGAIARYARKPESAGAFFAAAEAQIKQTPDLATEAEVLRRHAALLFELSAFDAAERRDVRAIAILRQLGDVATEAVVLGNLGNVYLDAGREAEAQPLYTRALALHRRLNDHRFEAIVGANRALALHLIGDLNAAFEQARTALRQHRRIGNRRFEGFCHYLLAGLHHERGGLEAALEHLSTTLQIWRSIGERVFTGFAHARLAVLEAERGAPELARQAIADAGRWLENYAGPGLAVHAGLVDEILSQRSAALPAAQGTTFARVGLRLRTAIHHRGRHA